MHVNLRHEDPLLAAFASIIAEEEAAGDKCGACEMDCDDFFSSLPEVVEQKQPKVGMTRWFQIAVTLRNFLPIRAKRLLIQLYLSLSVGLFKSGRASDLLRLPERSSSSQGDIQKTTTARDREDVQKLRKQCSNTLAFTTALLADQQIWHRLRVVSEVLEPVQAFHSWQNKLNRSPQESLEFWCFMASEQCYEHINAVLQKMHDYDLLGAVKMSMDGQLQTVIQKLRPDDPFVEMQDDTAQALGSFCLAVAGRRLRSIAELRDYPHRFAALLGNKASAVLLEMKADWGAWADMQAQSGNIWKQMQKRSCFNRKKVQQVFQLAEAANWKMTEEIAEIVRSDFSGITQTKLIEDGVRQGRVAEINKGFCKRVKPETLYNDLIHGDVACKKHRFANLDFASTVIPRGVESKSAQSLFRVPAKATPKDYKKVISVKQAADYHSPAPLRGTQSMEDIALTKWCAQQKQRHLVQNLFYSVLLPPCKIILRNKSFEKGAWFLAVRQFTGVSVLALPLAELTHEGMSYFVVDKVRKHFWLPMIEPTAWMCCSFVFKSPLSVKLKQGKWCHRYGCLMEPTCEPTHLLALCARNAFWVVPKTTLVTAAKQLGIEVDPASSLPQLILTMAEKILGKLSDEEKLQLLRKRLPKQDDVQELLMAQENLDELLEKDDHEQIVKGKEDRAALKREFSEYIREYSAKARASAAATRSTRGRSSDAQPAEKKCRRYPTKLPKIKESINLDDLNACLPAACRFGVDKTDHYWRLSAYGTRYGRSWRLYGVHEAAMQLIRLAWQLAIDEGHESACPFEELKV